MVREGNRVPKEPNVDGHGPQAVSSASDGVPATAVLAEASRLRAERDDLRERVDSLTTALENLVRVRNDFIAMASHDLKSPLTTILSGAQLIERLLEDPVPDVDKAVKWTRTIQDKVRVMTLLINDLLDASRIQSGAFDLRVAFCDVNAVVATVVKRLGPDSSDLVDVSPASEPAVGEWDGQRIEQVLANLLDNALKYSPRGASIGVVVEQQHGEVTVAVTDRGVGIAIAELCRVFDQFYRTPDAKGSSVAGVGLGLYICHQVITTARQLSIGVEATTE